MVAAIIGKEVEETILRRLSYNKETGSVIWLDGKRAGRKIYNTSCDGYHRLKILGSTYYLHRVCWFLHYREWPTSHLDHVNGDKTDNRIVNLRVASSTQNSANRSLAVNNTTGHKGVVYLENISKYMVRVGSSPRVLVGYFENLDDAAKAYNDAAKELYGEYARLNNV